MDCRKGLKATKILFYSGLGLLPLGIAAGAMAESEAVMGVLGVLGVIGIVAGLVICITYVRCPFCGESLMLGGRIPGELPRHCPGCGKAL